MNGSGIIWGIIGSSWDWLDGSCQLSTSMEKEWAWVNALHNGDLKKISNINTYTKNVLVEIIVYLSEQASTFCSCYLEWSGLFSESGVIISITVCSASGSERSSITVSSSKEGNPLLIALSERRLIALDRPTKKNLLLFATLNSKSPLTYQIFSYTAQVL